MNHLNHERRDPVLELSRLTKQFGERVALRDVSFGLHRGEVVALLGPNGAGKTTTLRLLAGLLSPTSGTVSVEGIVPDGRTWPRARARIGFLTETPGLWDRLTVEANLLTYAHLYGMSDAKPRVDALLRRVGLEQRATDPAGTLSKGMRQKVALARALLPDPPILLLDEPTSGLDPAMTRGIREAIGEFREEGRAVLLSTHNLDEAERVSDRVAVLNQVLVAIDTPTALRARRGGSRVRVTLATPDAASFLDVANGAGAAAVVTNEHVLECTVQSSERDTPRLVRALAGAGAQILAVTADAPGLEDVYLSLIRDSDAPGALEPLRFEL